MFSLDSFQLSLLKELDEYDGYWDEINSEMELLKDFVIVMSYNGGNSTSLSFTLLMNICYDYSTCILLIAS